MATLYSHTATSLPLRRPSLVEPQTRRSTTTKTGSDKGRRTRWNLYDLRAIEEAAERVRQNDEAWRDRIITAQENAQLKEERELEFIQKEREARNAARIEAEEAARQVSLAIGAARLAEEAERRQWEAELRLREEEQRREAEEAANLTFALVEQERLEREERQALEAAIEVNRLAEEEDASRAAVEAHAAEEVVRLAEEREERRRRQEAEAAAEVARIAEEEDLRRRQQEAARRQAQEAEERRRARLRDCAVCLEQHDLAGMVLLTCQHWYCHDDLRGEPRFPRDCIGHKGQYANKDRRNQGIM